MEGSPNYSTGLAFTVTQRVPSTQYLRTLVPKAEPLMVCGTRVLEYWVLGLSGLIYIYIALRTRQPLKGLMVPLWVVVLFGVP